MNLNLPLSSCCAPVTGKVLDHLRLPGHDFGEVESDLAGFEPPRRSVLRQVTHFRRVEQRLARHAAAQDASPPTCRAAFDDQGFEARAGGRSGRGVTGAASAQNGDLEVEFSHGLRMRKPPGLGKVAGAGIGGLGCDEADLSRGSNPLRTPRVHLGTVLSLPPKVRPSGDCAGLHPTRRGGVIPPSSKTGRSV